MAAKKSTDVMIAGKVYTLSGYEEEGYLQRVASYINTKISEITERDEFRRIPNDMKSILIQLNIADDYFKARSQYENAEENYKKAEKDLFELKHELVDTQMKVEELLEKLDKERQEHSRKSDREQNLEENYQKLNDKYQLLLNNAKVSDEKNRQFEEMLHLTQQEKRELEAVNKELRLNKEKLEATLADALLGAAKQDAEAGQEEKTKQDTAENKKNIQEYTKENTEENTIKNTKENIKENAKENINENIKNKQTIETENTANQKTGKKINQTLTTANGNHLHEAENKTDQNHSDADPSDQELNANASNTTLKKTPDEPDFSVNTASNNSPDASAQNGTDEDSFLMPAQLSKEEINELRDTVNTTMAELTAEETENFAPKGPEMSSASVEKPQFSGSEPIFAKTERKETAPVMAELSEEELAELLAPVDEPVPAMQELSGLSNLSKEELEELLAPSDTVMTKDAYFTDNTDPGQEAHQKKPSNDNRNTDSNQANAFHRENSDAPVPSVITEISEEDDPELQEIARQIAEMERHEQAEKQKKKDKKRQKRRH